MAYEGVKAQTCITSPPYFGLRDYGRSGQIGLEPTPDAYVAQLVEVFRYVRDVLADDGTLWLNLGDSYASGTKGSGGAGKSTLGPNKDMQNIQFQKMKPRQFDCGLQDKQLIGIPWRVAFALQADGWILRSDIIWSKPNPMPESVTDRPTKAHEYLFLFAKQPKYYYDAGAIKERAVGADKPRIFAAESRGDGSACAVVGRAGRQAKGASGFGGSELRNARTVWTITPKPFKGAHFATFPPDLVRPCILAGSRAGDTVLDPFMGSGTVAQVAKENGRNYLGCELNPEYVKLHAERGI
jgi:DNA modification methylase